MWRVGIRVCGSCNPAIMPFDVLREVKEIVEDVIFFGCEERNLDAYLFICGCPELCPVKELGFEDHPRTVIVAGDTLDDKVIPEETLPRMIVSKLLATLAQTD